MRKNVLKLARGKGMGLDNVAAELINAAAESSVTFFHKLLADICEWLYVPFAWRGGRIVVLFKGKGSSTNTDNYRGLLLSDHSAKIFTGLIQDRIYPMYHEYIPSEQLGAAKKRGADFVAHMTSSFINCCNLQAHCFFVLFIDLSKAFDLVIREILFGVDTQDIDVICGTFSKMVFALKKANK